MKRLSVASWICLGYEKLRSPRWSLSGPGAGRDFLDTAQQVLERTKKWMMGVHDNTVFCSSDRRRVFQ